MQLPNQDQFNNPWLPLSTQGLIPDANNPRAEQALAVGAARFHAKHDLLSSSYQEFERPNHNAFCAYDHSNPARQSQERQGGMLRSINDASIRPYQRITGIEDAIHSNQYVYQPLAPSGGVHFTSGANVLYRAPAVPARMAMEEMAGNEGSSRRHSYSSDQAAGALPPSGGFVQLGRPLEISTDTDRTAYSSWSYDLCPLSNAWAPSFDIPASKPAAQAVVPRMNIGAPYTGYCHDEGGTSVGAAVCVAASSAPGPTRNIIGACGTARSRSDAAVFHRSPRRAVGYVGYNQTHLKVPTRRATRPSRSRATRGPFVQFEADKDALATRLLNEGADSTAVELLLTHVFNDEVSARALTVNSMCREQPTGASSTRSNYRLLLADVERKDGSKGYCCLLCPQGHRKEYKNPQDSIRHLRKAHFGFAASCTGGCGRLFYRQSEMNQHLRKYCQVNVDGRDAPARPSASNT